MTHLKEQSVRISRSIAERVANLSYIESIVKKPENMSPSRGDAPWNPASLADGIPGIWVLFAEWDHLEPEKEWRMLIHQHVLSLTKDLTFSTPNLSLFAGITGLSYGLLLASDNRTHYRQAMTNLNHYIVRHLATTILEASQWNALEVVNGLSGAGRYILECSQDEGIRDIADLFFSMLIAEASSCMEDISCSRTEVVQLGVAHGLAGILALFTTALHKGFEVDGLQAVIHNIADYLAKHVRRDRFGLYWPISSERHFSLNDGEEESREIEGWCHGTLGIAVTLLRTGLICDNDHWKAIAQEAAGSVFKLGDYELNSMTSSFCHGLAGLLQLSNSIYALCGSKDAALFSDIVADKLVNRYDESVPFGYQDMEDRVLLDSPGLLQGAVGIALSLLEYGRRDDPQYSGKWRELFFIA
ncbi:MULTISPECIES: lanthionine synthetase C family protein [Paenibacillus]|uniref:Lanthionine synthetase n=1 Tax=Paenibacillus campinasensis TaxID=66347 RepID=A0A268EJU0_9BACL|nr:lanthionine synthetase C family protein [Paenibacillus campinasensis]PAD73397.1 hypothetical protein CHH67_20145 [Paenibacillus campinasensis]PAK51187.1 hypothetical protein CHH75_15830 [Paenibacillus sp. 7541]